MRQSKEYVAYAEVEIEKVVKDLNMKKSENLELKNCLAERDQQILQLKKQSIIDKSSEQTMLLAAENEYEDLEKKYNQLLLEYSSFKTVQKSVLEKNSYFLNEEKFYSKEIDRQKKKIVNMSY